MRFYNDNALFFFFTLRHRCEMMLFKNTKESDYPYLSANDSQKRQEGRVAVGVDFMSIRSPVKANV